MAGVAGDRSSGHRQAHAAPELGTKALCSSCTTRANSCIAMAHMVVCIVCFTVALLLPLLLPCSPQDRVEWGVQMGQPAAVSVAVAKPRGALALAHGASPHLRRLLPRTNACVQTLQFGMNSFVNAPVPELTSAAASGGGGASSAGRKASGHGQCAGLALPAPASPPVASHPNLRSNTILK